MEGIAMILYFMALVFGLHIVMVNLGKPILQKTLYVYPQRDNMDFLGRESLI